GEGGPVEGAGAEYGAASRARGALRLGHGGTLAPLAVRFRPQRGVQGTAMSRDGRARGREVESVCPFPGHLATPVTSGAPRDAESLGPSVAPMIGTTSHTKDQAL